MGARTAAQTQDNIVEMRPKPVPLPPVPGEECVTRTEMPTGADPELRQEIARLQAQRTCIEQRITDLQDSLSCTNRLILTYQDELTDRMYRRRGQ